MEMLPEVNDEVMPKHHKIVQAIAANRRLKFGLAIAVLIIILGAIAIFSTYSSIATKVEAKIKDKYEDQIIALEEKLQENEEKYEKTLNKEKDSYKKELEKTNEQHTKELENVNEKHTKELAKKDEIIAEKQAEIERLIAENMVNFNKIQTEIKEVGKLTTLDYYYTYAGTHKDADEFFNISGWEMPWTKNSFLAQWDGVVACGVDLAKVVISVDENTKVITVSMPTAEIFYHDVFEDSFEILDEKNNIFNPITVDDKVEFDKKYENMIFEKIKENRILEDAYNNATIAIENIINATPNVAGQYTIAFKQIT